METKQNFKNTSMESTSALKKIIVITGIVLFFGGGLICLRGFDGNTRSIGMILSGAGSILFLIGAVI